MKQVAGLICLASFGGGIVWAEYEIMSRLGFAFILIAGASASAALSGALYRAPEGYEDADGLHICRRKRRSALARYVRLFQQQVRREWT